MYLIIKYLIRCVIFLQFLELGTSYTVDRNITQSDCQTICIASGGQAEFDVETKLCKCLLSKNVDDTDVALINKNAKLVGKNLDGADTTDREIIIKREIHDEDKSTTEPTTTIRFVSETTVINDKIITTAEPEKETETDLNPEAIVGQAPQRRIHHPRLGPQRRQREPRPITPEQQHLMLQQIHDHLQRLEQLSDQRLRQIEIDAVNVSLRQLSQTVVHTPAQRSRFRNVVEETRRRQQRQRLGPHGRLVGAAAPHNIENSTAKTESEVESALKEIFHGKKQRHFEIITQDPRLIDE